MPVLIFFQKLPSRDVLMKRCSENMEKIYRRTSIPKCDFNKVALLCNFIEIALWYVCSPVNLLHIFRIPFPKNTFGRLLLFFRVQNHCILTFSTDYRHAKVYRFVQPWKQSNDLLKHGEKAQKFTISLLKIYDTFIFIASAFIFFFIISPVHVTSNLV